MSTHWIKVANTTDIAPGGMRTARAGSHRLVIGRTAGGEPFALDNRCPHEGYPLATGTLKDATLTCCWHNWKFDVRDGRCQIGGENVRSFPVRVDGDDLLVDVTEPDPRVRIPALEQSLLAALGQADTERALRDTARLLAAGSDPWQILALIAAWDGRHGEWGSTHALALAADCGRRLAELHGVAALAAIAPVIDSAGEANARLPAHPALPAIPPPADFATALRAAVEVEDLARAEGLLRGAFAAGVSRTDIETALYACVADHFLSFGHPLIYLVKAQELLHHAGDAHAQDIYVGLLRRIVYATREDTLPYLKQYRAGLLEVAADLPALAAAQRADAVLDELALRDAVLDGEPRDACAALRAALEAGVAAQRIARVLVLAGAHRLLRFDVAIEQDPEVAENWLWATHRFTFAAAVRHAIERFTHPDALRFLYQAVAFINSGRKLDLPAERRPDPAVPPAAPDAAALRDAVARRDPARAIAIGHALLAADPQMAQMAPLLEALVFGDRFVRPIFTAHAIKVMAAAMEEYAALAGDRQRDVPILAALWFLASPVAENPLPHSVHTALRLVQDGVIPRKLTQ